MKLFLHQIFWTYVILFNNLSFTLLKKLTTHLLTMDSEFTIFTKRLRDELQHPLPGIDAHLHLAPAIRTKDIKKGIVPAKATRSAVLALLFPEGTTVKMALILRNEYNGAHSGQVSLPGGKEEAQDPDLQFTALRETFEEIGVPASEIEVIGALSRFYVPPSNFVIQPFVGITAKRPDFRCDPVEVQRLIIADLHKDLAFEKLIKKRQKVHKLISITAPGWLVDGSFVWGATAMIISELIAINAKIDQSK